MSILKVDTINEKTSGNGVAIPGHVVQVAHNSQDGNIVTTSSAYTLGIACAITPKFATSKLKIMVLGGRNYYNSVAQHDLKLYVDGSAYAGSGRITSIYNNNSSTSSVHYGAWSIMEYADAGSTSARTYQLYHKNASGNGANVWLNNSSTGDIFLHMIIEEIAQ